MKEVFSQQRCVRIVIGEIGIAATSPLEARRLADALPAALERGFAKLHTGAPSAVTPRSRPLDRVVAQVTSTVSERLEGTT